MKVPIKNARLGQMLLRLFEHWQLSPNQQLSLLGLPPDNPTCPHKYLCGRPLNNDHDKLERASALLSIHKSLRLLFPRNRNLAYRWIQQPNRAFEGQTPIEVIERNGMQGMYMVLRYLDEQLAGNELTLEGMIKANPKSSFALDEEDKGWLFETATASESSNHQLNDRTDEVLQLLDTWMTTVRTFTNEELARDWITTYVPALGCTPVTLLTTKQGRDRVLRALKRIENGDLGG